MAVQELCRDPHGLYSRSLVRALDVSGKHFIQDHAGGCEAILEVPIRWTSGAMQIVRDYVYVLRP